MTCLVLTEHHHDRRVSVRYIVEHFDRVEPLLCRVLPKPMQGFCIQLYVFSRHDDEMYILHSGALSHLDCRTVLADDRNFNMLAQARLSAVNDGRHPKLFSQVLTSDRTKVWELFIHVLHYLVLSKEANLPDLVFFCDHGRHRSAAVATAFAIILRWLGGTVQVRYNDPVDRGHPHRYHKSCHRHLDQGLRNIPRDILQHAMGQVSSAAIRKARALSQHPDHEKFCLFLTTIIEFEDYYV